MQFNNSTRFNLKFNSNSIPNQEFVLNDARPSGELVLATGALHDDKNASDFLMLPAKLIPADRCVARPWVCAKEFRCGRSHNSTFLFFLCTRVQGGSGEQRCTFGNLLYIPL